MPDLSQYLHGGRNFGAIRIKTLRQEFVLPIEVVKKKKHPRAQKEEKKKSADKASVYEYSKLLLQEFTLEADQQLNRTLMKKTENLRVRLPEDIECAFGGTDQLLKNGRKDTAVSALAEMRDAVLNAGT